MSARWNDATERAIVHKIRHRDAHHCQCPMCAGPRRPYPPQTRDFPPLVILALLCAATVGAILVLILGAIQGV